MDDISLQKDDTLVIRTNRLTKAFGNLVAVNDLHLQVMRGDVFGFLGPNGSGKTTTIRMLLGLIRPTAGSAILFGMDNAYQLSAILQRIGAIVETPVFYPYLTGLDNLRVVAASSGMVSGKANDRRLAEVLDIVELQRFQKMPFSQYSLGMKQRLGIAAALLTDPELVMLDEPTNGLDPAGVIEIRHLITRLSELGKTIFLSSHILYEVQQVCNRVAILMKGNLVKQGNVADLLRGSELIEARLNSEEETVTALQVLQEFKEAGADWIDSVRIEKNKNSQPMIVIAAPAERSSEINGLLARREVFAAELHPRVGSLEEVFLEATTPVNGGGPGLTALAREPEEMPEEVQKEEMPTIGLPQEPQDQMQETDKQEHEEYEVVPLKQETQKTDSSEDKVVESKDRSQEPDMQKVIEGSDQQVVIDDTENERTDKELETHSISQKIDNQSVITNEDNEPDKTVKLLHKSANKNNEMDVNEKIVEQVLDMEQEVSTQELVGEKNQEEAKTVKVTRKRAKKRKRESA